MLALNTEAEALLYHSTFREYKKSNEQPQRSCKESADVTMAKLCNQVFLQLEKYRSSFVVGARGRPGAFGFGNSEASPNCIYLGLGPHPLIMVL